MRAGRRSCRSPRQRKLPEGVEREVWLWDFAGQADYRLIHQLYMDGTDVALLVFNPQDDDPYEGLAEWDRDDQPGGRGPAIRQAARRWTGSTGAACA